MIMIDDQSKKDLCIMLHEIFEGCDPYGANAMETLRNYVRETAGVPDPPGHWYYKSDGLIRNKIGDMVNHFVSCEEPPGPFYDEHGKYKCVLCDGWNGLHHNCPIASLRNEVYSFDEFCDRFLEMVKKYHDIIPKD